MLPTAASNTTRKERAMNNVFYIIGVVVVVLVVLGYLGFR
jgi:predicted nucleic acid-binding Zn ribbon protein